MDAHLADTEVRAPVALVLGPCCAMGGWARIGFFGLRGLAAHRGGGLRLNAHWSGHGGPAAGGRESGVEKVESRHGGPRSRGAGSGPLPRDGRMGADWGFWSQWFVALGPEMSPAGGLCGPVALGPTG